jgi:hypothetical protein
MKGISERYYSIREEKRILEGFVSGQLRVRRRNMRNDREKEEKKSLGIGRIERKRNTDKNLFLQLLKLLK